MLSPARISAAFLALISLVHGSAVVQCQPGEELLINGDFEALELRPWHVGDYYPKFHHHVRTGAGPDGSRAFEIMMYPFTGGGDPFAALGQSHKPCGNTSLLYDFSFDYKFSSAEKNLSLIIHPFYNLIKIRLDPAFANVWQSYSNQSLTNPRGGRTVQFQFHVKPIKGNGDVTISLDNIKLVVHES